MFRVEIGLADVDRLVEMVDTMRAWFDQHHAAPVTFGYSLSAAITLFRIDFANEEPAAAFATAFGGAVVEYPACQGPA